MKKVRICRLASHAVAVGEAGCHLDLKGCHSDPLPMLSVSPGEHWTWHCWMQHFLGSCWQRTVENHCCVRILQSCELPDSCHCAGTPKLAISNERLHAALSAPALHLVTALAQQIAGGAPAEAPRAAVRSSSGSGGIHRQEGLSRAESEGSNSKVNVCVMEGVQEDAYRGWGPNLVML